ncbi:MAG: hypothetical protein ACRYFX_19460 [Janthinobacterium lividum]
MLAIVEVLAIKSQLLVGAQGKQRFPKVLAFPFGELYQELATRLPTTEISSECILLSSAEAINETREFVNPAYWAAGYAAAAINDFWFFGRNGQGDSWLFDQVGQVYFYDHNQGELARQNFTDLGLTFKQWLQYAFLNKQLDELYEAKSSLSEADTDEYRHLLAQLSPLLLANYPFTL